MNPEQAKKENSPVVSGNLLGMPRVSPAYNTEHLTSELRVYWIIAHFCGETESVSLLIKILRAKEEIWIKLA